MRFILIALLACTIIFTGCNTTENTNREREEIAEKLNPTRNLEKPENEETNSELGYVRYTKDQLTNEQGNSEISIDRNEMADSITRIILSNNGFEEVATLVTDKEVLIAYERNEATPEKEAADIARRTALSIMPSFYTIYVSDNETLMQDIQSLHNSTSQNRDYDNTINSIIKEMKKSSQGHENN